MLSNYIARAQGPDWGAQVEARAAAPATAPAMRASP